MEKHKALDQKSLEMWQQCGEVERKARNHEAPETCRLSRMGSEEMHDKLTHLTKTKRTIQILGKKGGYERAMGKCKKNMHYWKRRHVEAGGPWQSPCGEDQN